MSTATENRLRKNEWTALKDKIAYEHCFMATFRENFRLGAGNEPQN